MLTHSIMTSVIIGAYVVLWIAPVSPKSVVCYFLNWAQYRPAPCSHTVRNINPFLCTHGVYAFSKLDGNRIAPTEWNDDTPTGQWRQFNDLKKINPNFKTLLSVGGYLHGSYRFHLMAKTQANRAEFISSTIALLRNWTFDGLDIDWEYPGNDSPDDMSYLTELLKELREAFHQESISSKRSPLLLSVAVASGVWQASSSYNVTSLDQYVDMVNVMTYDYHGSWQKTTGLNAPMFSNDGLDVHSTITWYTNNGLRADKIFLGIALYGRTWTLADPSLNGVGAPAVDSGIAGNCTKEKGTLAYFEICDLLRNKGYTETLDYIGQQKYAYNGDQWVSYDDKQSLNIKMDYIDGFNLGGAMVWALSDDDFSGQFCGEGNYSILGYVTSRLSDQSTTFSTTVTSTTKTAFSTAAETTTVATTTATTKPTSTTTTTIPTTTPTSTTTKPTTLTTVSTTTTTSPPPPTTTTTKPTTTTTTSTISTTTSIPTTTTTKTTTPTLTTTTAAPTTTTTKPTTTTTLTSSTTSMPTTTKTTTTVAPTTTTEAPTTTTTKPTTTTTTSTTSTTTSIPTTTTKTTTTTTPTTTTAAPTTTTTKPTTTMTTLTTSTKTTTTTKPTTTTAAPTTTKISSTTVSITLAPTTTTAKPTTTAPTTTSIPITTSKPTSTTTAPTTTISTSATTSTTTTTAKPTTTPAMPTITTSTTASISTTTTTKPPTTTTTAPSSTTSTTATTSTTQKPTTTSQATAPTTKPTTTTAAPTIMTTTGAPTTATIKPTTQPSLQTSTTAAPIQKAFICPKSYGFFADPYSCSAYYVCSSGVAIPVKCPQGTVYNSDSVRCENQLTTKFVCTI
ncbi:oviduct-specific glycoprotein-like [Biomphalaria glabrata]|uniref:Oviduct-specific glycoprotein-like n=1 Tax=Biomphalaria glabrata TaxID=6526 RepID=A0A9W2ZJV5_BIOGL|nr:oviduct-specific glycoprotein-like [Biomphalaria glabrata]